MTNHITAIQFTGTSREYFGIWVVNLFLSIITLGLYSPWAKVRYKKYFYQNTLLDGVGFDYHANPITILKGRLIAVALVIFFQVASNFNIIANVIVSALLLLFTPWLVQKGMRFNARNSSYRGIRFNFDGGLMEASLYFLILPSLLFITFGLAYPLIQQRISQFKWNHYYFGLSNFRLKANISDFYRIYLKLLGLILLTYIIIAICTFVISQIKPLDHNSIMPDIATHTFGGWFSSFSTLFSLFILLSPVLLFFAYIKANIANLIWNNTYIEQIRFESTQRVRDIAWLYLTNTLAVLFTAGLATPWAQIRLAKYRLEHLSLIGSVNWADYIGQQQAAINAIGEEVADFFDIDIGL